MTNLPPGAPSGDAGAERLADVWCTHGVMWTADAAGYLPTEIDEAHPDLPCRELGAIPATCWPVVPYEPKRWPNAGPGAVAGLLDEMPP